MIFVTISVVNWEHLSSAVHLWYQHKEYQVFSKTTPLLPPDILRVIGTITRRENASAPWQPDTTVCRAHAVTSLGSVLSTARKMPRLSAALTLAEDRGRFCRISDHFSEVRVFPFPMPLSVSCEVIVNIPIF